MKKIVLTLSLLIASVSFVNATNVEPNTKKQDEPVKKEKLNISERMNPITACWAAAEEAEATCCGWVGCSFEIFDRVYSRCINELE